MAAWDARLFSFCKAKFRAAPSRVGTPLIQLGEEVRPRVVAASEVAKMAAPRSRRHPGRLEPRLEELRRLGEVEDACPEVGDEGRQAASGEAGARLSASKT